jgi:hypothetical protein
VGVTPTEAVTIALPAIPHTVAYITWEMCAEPLEVNSAIQVAISGLFNLGEVAQDTIMT